MFSDIEEFDIPVWSAKGIKERKVDSMEGTTKFKSLGVVDLDGASIGDGQIEVHMPIDEAAEQLEKVLDKCTEDYLKEHKNVSQYTEKRP